jgi:3-oxoacyl-[acyl-carrier protein] reductase
MSEHGMSEHGTAEHSTVVVSGAGTGIGRALAGRLAAAGCHVTAVGRRPEPLNQLAGELGPQVDPVAADVATEAGAEAVAARVAAAGRGCAGVVAAAGGIPGGRTAGGLTGIRQDWQALFESNVLSAVLLVEALREAIGKAGRPGGAGLLGGRADRLAARPGRWLDDRPGALAQRRGGARPLSWR